MNRVRLVLFVLVAFLGLTTLFNSCERIDAGHVGVKVNMYGDGKGVDDITEVTGWAFYNPFTQKIYEFPTFVQHKEYVKTEDGDESFIVIFIKF